MTTYNNIEFTTIEDLRNAINSDLSGLAYPYTVKHKTYGEGQLTFVKAPLMGGSLYATIEFTSSTKKLSVLSMDVVLSAGLLDMPEMLYNKLTDAQTAFKNAYIEKERAEMKARIEDFEKAREAKKQAAKEKKREEKRAKKQAEDFSGAGRE